MLSQKMQAAMNKQINAELHSAYIYLSMSAYFEDQNLPGFAHWMRMQWGEEIVHSQKFFDFIHERRGRVLLAAIDAVPTEWDSPLAAFENAFEHECLVSRMIDELVNLALEEKDHAANSFLQWFVDEQVEEEASADAIVQQLKLIGNSGDGIYMLDREMGARQAGADEDE